MNKTMHRWFKRLSLLMGLIMLITVFPMALSASADIPRKEAGLQSFPVYANATIYKGALVCINSSGYAIAGANTAGNRFVGVAYEKIVGTSSSGAVNCRVYTMGTFKLTATSITQAMVGQMMYLVDDATVDDFTSRAISVGTLVEYVSTTSGWVDIGKRGIGMVNGAFSSTAAGLGIMLNSTMTAGNTIYADDGGVALTAGNYRAGLSRMLVSTAITSGDISITGHQGHLKVAASIASSGYISGLYGYIEVIAGKSVTSGGAVRGMFDLPSTAEIASGHFVGAFQAYSNDLGGTHTGKAVVVAVPNPAAGAWDAFASLGSTSMTFDTTSISSDMTPTGYKGIPVYINGVLGYIPWATAWA